MCIKQLPRKLVITTQKRKIALVTGGSRGLGRNTVLSLAKRGINSIFTYNSNHAAAEQVVGLGSEAGVKSLALQLDTGATKTFDSFAEKLEEVLKVTWNRDSVDYLVNNAGTSHHAAFGKVTEEDMDSSIRSTSRAYSF